MNQPCYMNYNLFKSFLSDHWMRANLKIPNLKAEGGGLLGRALFMQAGRSELGSQAQANARWALWSTCHHSSQEVEGASLYRLTRLTELARSTLKQETLPQYVRWNMCKEEHSIWLLHAQIHVQICTYTHVNTCMLPNHLYMSMQTKKSWYSRLLSYKCTSHRIHLMNFKKIQLHEPHSQEAWFEW